MTLNKMSSGRKKSKRPHPSSEIKPIRLYKSSHRSRITNGRSLLWDVDGRSHWVRRFRDVIALHINDLGGADAVSVAEASIIRRAATLTIELEQMETKFARKGEAAPWMLELYQKTANSLRRQLEAVGLKRRAKDVTPPSLQTYLRNKSRADADDDDVIDAEAE